MPGKEKSRKKGFLQRLKDTPFFIKLLNWEYWSTAVVYAPAIPMWLYFSLRARALTFFSAANPAMKMGGLVLASKIDILNRIPEEFIPKTIFVDHKKLKVTDIERQMIEKDFTYPVIAKPDVGERGLKVQKIENSSDLTNYLESNAFDFLVQEFITLPNESGILYHRLPDASTGMITSVCLKETLKVTGDGVSSILELMEESPRAKLQINRMQESGKIRLDRIPEKDEILELEPIGNHNRGTMFLNGNHLIDEELTATFDMISLQMKDLYYGRFDLKYNTFEELKQGRNFKIMELNGVNSEPAHIYQPGYSIFKAYGDIYRHLKIIYAISKKQRERGISFIPFREFIQSIYQYFSYKRRAKAL
ncbi:MAG: hypothetical protein AAF502_12475 [Bacteroidota bacterium]